MHPQIEKCLCRLLSVIRLIYVKHFEYCISQFNNRLIIYKYRDGGESSQNQNITMKQGIHPDYRPVVFHDLSADYKFLTQSCVKTTETTEFEGETYPVFKIEVSSQSHPFYTGKNVLLDTAGRVDKFYKRFGGKK